MGRKRFQPEHIISKLRPGGSFSECGIWYPITLFSLIKKVLNFPATHNSFVKKDFP